MVAGVDLYEPQFLALFVFGGFVILSSIVYLVSAFSMQEKSYEDAVAEQKARMEKEQQINMKDSSKPKKKYPRKKKEKEKTTENHHDHVPQQEEVIPPAKIEEEVEEPPPAPKKAKSPKTKKENKKKENKEAANKTPQQSPKPTPVEEVIVPKVQQVVKSAPPPKKEKHQKVVEEPIMVAKKETKSHAAPPPRVEEVSQKKEPAQSPSKAKKNKTASASGEPDNSVRSLIAALKSAKLNDGEVQKIVAILHQKGHSVPAEDWIKANQRSDPVAQLKKQLQEKEQALHNEMLLAQSSNQKAKEIRAELVQEKSRANQIEEHYKKKMDAQSRDVDALHIRMRQTHEAHAHENNTLQARVKQLQGMNSEANIEAVKQLQEENSRLKTEANHAAQQKEQIMGAELGRLQNELQKMQGQCAAKDAHVRQSDEIRRNLEAKTAQYEQQMKQAGSRENETALSKRLSEVSEELRKSDSRSQTLAHDLEKSNETLRAITQERDGVSQQIQEFHRKESESKNAIATLEAKLKDTTSQAQNLESRVRSAESKLSEDEKLRLKKDEEVKSLQSEKAKLETKLQQLNKSVEQLQKSNAPNGDVTDQAPTPKEKTVLLIEHEKMLSDKAKTIEALQKQLESNTTEAEKLKKDVEKSQKKNNDLRERNRKVMEALSATESSVADKLDKAVKSAKDDTQADLLQEQQLAKASLQRIFPAVKVDSKLSHKDWVSQFEKSAADILKQVSSSTQTKEKELSSKLTTVEEEKEKLSTQCQHYQSVLGETEGVLNKLQSSVESEAKKWQEKLKQSEASLVEAKRENASLKEDLKKKDGNDKASSEDNQKLTKELAAAKANEAALEKARSAAGTELAGVKQQLTQLQKELAQTTQKGSAGNAEVKAQLVKEQEQVKKLTSDLATATASIQQLKQGTTVNQQEVDKYKVAVAESSKKLEALQNQNTTQIKSLQADLEKAKAEKVELEKSSGQLKEKDAKLEGQEKELTTMKAALTKEKLLTKDLGTAAAKLQGALKKMQQALMEEKKVTATLKAQTGTKEETPVEKASSLTDSQVELQLADAADETPKAKEKAEGGSAV